MGRWRAKGRADPLTVLRTINAGISGSRYHAYLRGFQVVVRDDYLDKEEAILLDGITLDDAMEAVLRLEQARFERAIGEAFKEDGDE